jgi:hypothetical protein
MESFWDSVKLMLFVYALAAVVSFTVAWVIKLIFAGVQKQKVRAEARNATPETAP